LPLPVAFRILGFGWVRLWIDAFILWFFISTISWMYDNGQSIIKMVPSYDTSAKYQGYFVTWRCCDWLWMVIPDATLPVQRGTISSARGDKQLSGSFVPFSHTSSIVRHDQNRNKTPQTLPLAATITLEAQARSEVDVAQVPVTRTYPGRNYQASSSRWNDLIGWSAARWSHSEAVPLVLRLMTLTLSSVHTLSDK
jgi:hypothetical protein